MSGNLNPNVNPSCTREGENRPCKYPMGESQQLPSEQFQTEGEVEVEGEDEEDECSLYENPEEFFFNNRLIKSFLHEPVGLEWIYEQSQQLRPEQEQQEQLEGEQVGEFGEQTIQSGLTGQVMIPISQKLQELLECYRNNSQRQEKLEQEEEEQQQQPGVKHTGEGVKMMHQNEQTMNEPVTESEYEQNQENQNYLYVIFPIRITEENTQQQEQQQYIPRGLRNRIF